MKRDMENTVFGSNLLDGIGLAVVTIGMAVVLFLGV